jgi:hypothetical protein
MNRPLLFLGVFLGGAIAAVGLMALPSAGGLWPVVQAALLLLLAGCGAAFLWGLLPGHGER